MKQASLLQALDTLREHHSFHEIPQQDVNGQAKRRPVDLSQLSLQNKNEAQVGSDTVHQVPVMPYRRPASNLLQQGFLRCGTDGQSLSSALQTVLSHQGSNSILSPCRWLTC